MTGPGRTLLRVWFAAALLGLGASGCPDTDDDPVPADDDDISLDDDDATADDDDDDATADDDDATADDDDATADDDDATADDDDDDAPGLPNLRVNAGGTSAADSTSFDLGNASVGSGGGTTTSTSYHLEGGL